MDQVRQSVVFIHEDSSGGSSLVRLAKSAGLLAELYVSIDSFLADESREKFGCAVLYESSPDDKAFQALRERSGPYRELLPVILLGPSDDAGLRQRAKSLGAKGFFQEPVDGEALVDAIRWQLCIPDAPKNPSSNVAHSSTEE